MEKRELINNTNEKPNDKTDKIKEKIKTNFQVASQVDVYQTSSGIKEQKTSETYEKMTERFSKMFGNAIDLNVIDEKKVYRKRDSLPANIDKHIKQIIQHPNSIRKNSFKSNLQLVDQVSSSSSNENNNNSKLSIQSSPDNSKSPETKLSSLNVVSPARSDNLLSKNIIDNLEMTPQLSTSHSNKTTEKPSPSYSRTSNKSNSTHQKSFSEPSISITAPKKKTLNYPLAASNQIHHHSQNFSSKVSKIRIYGEDENNDDNKSTQKCCPKCTIL